MMRIVLADWRRILLFYAAGTGLWSIIHLFVVEDFAGNCCLQEPAEQPRIFKLLFLELVYCSCSLVFWAQSAMYDRCLLKLTETLPLSPNALNVARLLSCAAHFAPTLVNWFAVLATWRYFDLPVPVWIPVFALLSLAAYALIALRYLVLRYVLPVPIALVFFPVIEDWFAEVLEWSTTPWPSLVLLVAVLSFGSWAIRRPLPRWTRR